MRTATKKEVQGGTKAHTVETQPRIIDGKILCGDFPRNGKRLVKEFVLHYQKELIEMWQTGQFKKLPAIN